MKLPEIKRREAELRTLDRSRLSNKQQAAALNERPGESKRERARLSS